MNISAVNKTATYNLEELSFVESALKDIEDIALHGTCTPQEARDLISAISCIADALKFKRGVQRHKKFAPELQEKSQ